MSDTKIPEMPFNEGLLSNTEGSSPNNAGIPVAEGMMEIQQGSNKGGQQKEQLILNG